MFSPSRSTNIIVLHGEYSVPIIILSIVIACCASYTAISMNQRMKHNSFFHKRFWLILSSLSMGLGIWSMHFIGMSAFMLPISMGHDVLLTIISALPAVFFSYIAFSFANRTVAKTRLSTLIAATVMGLGISSMHYIGMAAMKMEADYFYKPGLFLASIAIAIIVSFAALFVFSTLQKYMENYLIKMVTSVLMGLSITSMHYIGMSAVVFYVEERFLMSSHHMHKMDMTLLITAVTVGILLILVISGLTSILDRYVDHRISYFDLLTLFPNKRKFEQDLHHIDDSGSLAIIHIHNLEKWISLHGYAFGDELIKAVGKVIQDLKPISSKVYRIEENRFAVTVVREQESENLRTSMDNIATLLKKPITVGHHQILVEMVCALSHSNGDSKGKELFLNNMGILQHSSTSYSHEVIEYDATQHTYSFEAQIVQDISKAIANNELFLVYQPKICPRSQKVYGVEALLRWNHPNHGMISPGRFIPILEKTEQIYDVTDWVIGEVCNQGALWLKENVSFGQISINIPGSYVTSSRLLNRIKHYLSLFKIDSKYLELEITETSVIHNIENAIITVNEFRKLGLSVALDDFGTGLSSLSYLKRIPITTIKIDKSFVDGVPQSEKDSSVLKAIVTLCNSLKLTVVIEGVESKEQFEFISSMDERPIIQGYYIAKPLQEREFVAWIQDR